MKKRSEWFQLLVEPYKTQALNNMWNDAPCYSLEHAVASMCAWENTPESHEYWHNFHLSLHKKKKDSIYPSEADWVNAPKGTLARYINENGYVFFHGLYPNEPFQGFLQIETHVATIKDMSNIDWETSLEIKP
jgi:hypothetical protein